jgi:hypothetical protein
MGSVQRRRSTLAASTTLPTLPMLPASVLTSNSGCWFCRGLSHFLLVLEKCRLTAATASSSGPAKAQLMMAQPFATGVGDEIIVFEPHSAAAFNVQSGLQCHDITRLQGIRTLRYQNR